MDVHLNNLFSRFQEQFGSGPGLGPGSGTCLMKIDGSSPPFVKSLYKAAASLYRTDPWRRLRPAHLLVLRSEDDAKQATGSRETIRVPNVELLRVTYEVETLMFLSNMRMIKSLALEKSGEDRFPVFDVVRCMSSGELEFRNPKIEELRFAYAVMRAIALVHPCSRKIGAGSKYSRLTCFQPFIETVDVQWSAEMAKGNDLVAVTISHPPNRGYEERNNSASSTPTKCSEEAINEETY
ncbi:UNVERIFIED_CONTAM: hypothetical protein Sradi_6009300 [Sesamum radiatum]|uniref:Uncharacterized protein n=1 Tax=Sesamum radiatum TaxID=300843 RepID=A0AAW2KJA4_SESRA